eukprot:2040497-Alexandrium_andersonii.AAC.1
MPRTSYWASRARRVSDAVSGTWSPSNSICKWSLSRRRFAPTVRVLCARLRARAAAHMVGARLSASRLQRPNREPQGCRRGSSPQR